MAGVAIRIDVTSLAQARQRLEAFVDGIRPADIMGPVAAIIESQTRRRISEDKTAPDGTPWADWSPAYAKTRGKGKSLLESGGYLLDSIFGEKRGDEAIIGSNRVYAAIHQFGSEDETVPARPYLGLEGEDADDVLDLVVAHLESLSL